MSHATWSLEANVAQYLLDIGQTESPALAKLRQRTQTHRLSKMAIAPEQAHLLVWIVKLIQAKHYLELGVFTGYSSTAIASALPIDGTVTACDINTSYTEWAKEAWIDAGIDHKITLHLQPALFTLDELISEGKTGYFDLAFIDADKPTTPEYFERCLTLVRSGGVIAIDNVLLNGKVLENPENAAHNPPSLQIMQKFNANLKNDSRITPITLPLGDGMTLLLKNY